MNKSSPAAQYPHRAKDDFESWTDAPMESPQQLSIKRNGSPVQVNG